MQPLEQSGETLRAIGGKAVQLLALRKLGAELPETWVLATSAFDDLVENELPAGHDPRTLLRMSQERTRIERAARARQRALSSPLGDELRAALGALADELLPRAPWGLAVRSSPTCDDDSVAFMAGLSSAVLGVSSGEGLCEAVRTIWGAAFFPRTLAYLIRRRVRGLSVAVVIQPVIAAEVSGVLSTRASPSALSATVRSGERLVNAAYGLGAVVTGGDAVVDVVRITQGGDLVSAFVAEKKTRLVSSGGGVHEEPVAPGEALSLSLSEPSRRALSELATRLDDEQNGGGAYDLAFAIEGEKVWVLQGQRAPRLGYPEGGDEHTVWSRATVTESLSGVVSPLTWSLSAPFVEAGFRRVFSRLGATIPKSETLITNVHGRAYLNLSALMRVAVQLPGVSPNTAVQLSGAEGVEAVEQIESVSRRGFYTKLPLTVGRQLSDQVGLGSEAAELEGAASDAHRALAELDLAILPDDALVPTLRDVRALLGRALGTLTSSTAAFVTAHLALRSALERSFPVEADRLAQQLTSGVPTLGSTRVAVGLGRVADIARDEAGRRELLLSGKVTQVSELPAGPTRRALDRYLDEHGDLCQQAAELLLPRWRESPAPLLSMLGAMVRGVRVDGERALSEVRARADRERALLERKIPLVDRLVVRALVDRTRHLTEVRERVRGWLFKILAMNRKVALEIDRRVLRISPKLGPGGVFFCSFDELIAALSTGRPDIEHIVRLRMAERARDVAQPDPPTSFVGAPPPLVLPPAGDAVMRGVASSGGEAIGRARVVRDVEREAGLVEPGEILVLKTADVGLSPLFLVAAGIVSQQGGRLTQGSVLARELGVPSVAHVSGATRVIRTGELLRVNGDDGVVERLEHKG